MLSPRSSFLAGVKAILPISLGVIPFGLISGVIAIEVGLPIVAAFAMSLLVFAGAAQLVAAQLISVNTPSLIIILATCIVNLRFIMYSASIAPYFAHLSRPWKWLSAYLLTDQAYALAITHFMQHPHNVYKHWYFLGAGFTMWCVWQVGSAIGILLGTQVPAGWQLDFTIPLAFMALLMPAITDRVFAVVALVAAITAVLTATLPFKLGLLISAFVGISIGLLLKEKTA
ncbi:MAG: AzlC family ABC transporter permease [Chloroflexota bacterium]